jgi:HlyD family secretion protein
MSSQDLDVIPFRPPARPETRDDPGREMRIGFGIAAAFFVGFLGWAAFLPLDAGANAAGYISVLGNKQEVQHQEPGVVTALHVVEGQHVKQGDVVMEISADEILAQERSTTAQYLSSLAQRARLIAERDSLPSIVPPVEFASLPAEDKPLAEQAMHVQELEFVSRRNAVSNQVGVYNQQAKQLAQESEGYSRQLQANKEQQKLIGEELAGVKDLAAKGFAPMTRVRELERSQAGLGGDAGADTAQMAKAQEGIGQAHLQALQIQRQMMQDVADQLRDTQTKIDDLQPKMKASREQLSRAYVRAPATGQVVGLSVFTVGGVIAAGQSLMQIVPDNKALVIEAHILPNDVDDLQLGQEVQIRFPALHERRLPVLKGTLTKLAADATRDEKSGQTFYTSEISVPPSALDAIRKVRGGNLGLRPGMIADVVIPLRHRTALSYLLEPLEHTIWTSFREH